MTDKMKKLMSLCIGRYHVLNQKVHEILREDEPRCMRNNGNLKAFLKQGKIVQTVFFAVTCLFITYIFGNFAVRPLFDEELNKEKKSTIRLNMSASVEGSIVDRNGDLIYGGAPAGEIPAVDEGHNWMFLGYRNPDEIGNQIGAGILAGCAEYQLYYLDSSDKGATVVLTVDTELQQTLTSLLETEPFASSSEGSSVIVMDNATGEIIAYASHSSADFDVNNPSETLNSHIDGAGYIRGVYENDPPGSTFKIITALAAYRYASENNESMDIFDYNDDGSEIMGASVRNAGDENYGWLDIHEAFSWSVNTFFANAACITGAERLKEMAESFLIGTTVEIPYFASFTSAFTYDPEHDDASPGTQVLCDTAYGQGYTQVTPMNLLLICNALANDGNMLQPHMVKRIYSAKKTLYEAETEIIAQPVTSDEAQYIKGLMNEAAEFYGLNEYGVFCAKTGTAECEQDAEGNTTRSHTYLAGFCDEYSFVISVNDGSSSYALYNPNSCSPAEQVIEAVNAYYERSES